jgi:predicted flap endonuclease-1-like 5' DNA nuclease
MTLKEKVEAIDSLVLTGKFVEAVDQFFHPDAVAHSAPTDRKSGKELKIESLKTFFKGIKQINHIQLHSYAVGDQVTMSEFTFQFTSIYGSPITWNEVIRRRWKDGLVYDEKYFTAEPTDLYTPVASTDVAEDKSGMNRMTAKYASPVPPPPLYLLKPEDIVYTRSRKAVVMPDFAAPAEASKMEMPKIQEQEVLIPEPILTSRIAKDTDDAMLVESIVNVVPDDLKKIEGIGPKIEQILNDGGIRTFKQLAVSNADAIKELLLQAGPRFRMHDPATWMEQADLAAKGDWTTLDTLQKALKGGRVAK